MLRDETVEGLITTVRKTLRDADVRRWGLAMLALGDAYWMRGRETAGSDLDEASA